MPHTPVLLQAVLRHLLTPTPPARLIDGTLGAGGHTRALLEAGAGEVLGLDQDAGALALAQQTLSDFAGRVHFTHTNYEHMAAAAAGIGWQTVDAVLLDIGVSSMQLDQPERGFSFMHDGPLDMRMNPAAEDTAADIVNTWDTGALTDIFFRYGEEKHSRKLARVIVERRPYTTTRQLAQVIAQHKPAQWKERIHPATRVFQALRIAVNDELGVLERTLPQAVALLRPGGRLAVISFHSLEDRIAKQTFKHMAADCVCPSSQPVCTCDKRAELRLITRKPIMPTPAEIEQNPRSRSARLRVVEKAV
jgi:16S rRNA (cytosine1402-N4)-methyltransferase